MSTRRRGIKPVAVRPTTPMVRALVAMAEMDALQTKCWITVDDLGYMAQKVFGLPDSNKISGAFVSQQLKFDKSLPGEIYDSYDGSNCTGIFRQRHNDIRYLFLCKPGESPPIGESWTRNIKSIERTWVPPSLNGGSYTFDFDELKEELKASDKETNKEERKKRPSIK